MGSIDWQISKPLWQCTKYLLENKIDCDVNFRVGEDPENIKAHKLILRLRSPVFERMFNGAFQESEKDPVIPDMTPAAFQTLLRYCYYDCLDIEDDVALLVLYAARKYMLPLLEEAAREKLFQVLNVSNIWDIYNYAVSVGDTELVERCQMYFEGNISTVRDALQAEAFLNISHETLLQFLQINHKVHNVPNSKKKYVPYQNNIGISISEIELFKACHAWAVQECLRQGIDPTGANKRTVLGECLFLIRFPTMLYKDLVNVVYQTGVLNQTEKENLCLYHHKETDSKCQVDFPLRERKFVVTTTGKPCLKVPPESTVSIESDVRVMLSRLWIQGSGNYRVTVRDEACDGSWSMRYDTKYENHGTTSIEKNFRILGLLDIEPRLLEPHRRYSITVENINRSVPPDTKLIPEWLMINEVSPFKEVKITCGTKVDNAIYALTLSLV